MEMIDAFRHTFLVDSKPHMHTFAAPGELVVREEEDVKSDCTIS